MGYERCGCQPGQRRRCDRRTRYERRANRCQAILFCIDAEIPYTACEVNVLRTKQVLELAPGRTLMRNFEVDEKNSTLRKLVIDLIGFGNLVCKIPNEDRIRRKGVTCTKADGVPLIFVVPPWEKVLGEEPE